MNIHGKILQGIREKGNERLRQRQRERKKKKERSDMIPLLTNVRRKREREKPRVVEINQMVDAQLSY